MDVLICVVCEAGAAIEKSLDPSKFIPREAFKTPNDPYGAALMANHLRAEHQINV